MNIIAHSGIGQRKENQDLILIEKLNYENSLYLIVDGMGGYENGKKAATIIAESIFNYLKMVNRLDSKSIEEAIKKANLSIKVFNENNSSKSGATLGGIIKNNEKTFLFWVGDVTLFLFKNDELIFRSKAHTLINELIDSGTIISAAKIQKYKHIVSRSISGKREIIKTDIYEIENNDYDKFIICSDGVIDMISIENTIYHNLDVLNTFLKNNSLDNYSYIYGN